MTRKKVLVVGGGIAGLASAIRLQHNGYDVEVYEKKPSSGGLMGLIEVDGFSFDLGPTILMMPHVYNSVFEYCGRNPDDYFQMTRLDPIYKVYFSDGSVHEATSIISVRNLKPYVLRTFILPGAASIPVQASQ